MQDQAHAPPKPAVWLIRLAGIALLGWLAVSAVLTLTKGGGNAAPQAPPPPREAPAETPPPSEPGENPPAAPGGEAEEEKDTPPEGAGPTKWALELQPNGAPVIRRGNAVLAKADFVFWDAGWSWKGSRFRVEESGGQYRIRGECAGLGLSFAGTVSSPAPNALEYDVTVEAEDELDGVIGGCLSWRLKHEAAALPAGAADPELLPEDRGWRWSMNGDAIEVAFEQPQPKVYFERGRKSEVRTFFVGEQHPAGKRRFTMRVSVPEGGEVVEAAWQRYGAERPEAWLANALDWRGSPVDLSGLNHQPAGERGFVQADGGRLVFEDGSPARFWGTNVGAYAIYSSKEDIEDHARRIAALGHNLVRIHHHDSAWVKPNVFGRDYENTQSLSAESLDKLDYWIKCLKDNGVYVWLDLHVGRELTDGDRQTPYGPIPGWEEIARKRAGLKGFCYLNDVLRKLMLDFNEQYLDRVNPYTGLRILDDPAVAGLLITNENDLTAHFGNLFLPDKNVPWHNERFDEALAAFCQRTGLPRRRAWKTWVPGPSKLFLADLEHRFNVKMLSQLRDLGAKVPIATTNYWATLSSYSLPPLLDGGLIDAHSYGGAEFLHANPLYEDNFVARVAGGRVAGAPLTISEWNVPYPAADRFCAPLYVAAVAALQGWDAPMVYNYAQIDLKGTPGKIGKWSTGADPAITSVTPAAALAFRRHVSRANKTFRVVLDHSALTDAPVDAGSSVAIRTLAEQSRVALDLPGHEALPWFEPPKAVAQDKAETIAPGETALAEGVTSVESDTGELRRDWAQGVFTIDAEAAQAFVGWVGGKEINLKHARLACDTPKAAVSVSSLTGQPIPGSDKLLITAAARAVNGGKDLGIRAEPVRGQLGLRVEEPSAYEAYAVSGGGERIAPLETAVEGGELLLELGEPQASLWYVVQKR